MTLSSSMTITPRSLTVAEGESFEHGSVLGGKTCPNGSLLGGNQQRAFLEARVAPEINAYWTRAEFPHHLVPEIAKLGIVGASYKGYGFRGRSAVLDGFIALELARVDSSIATFVGVHGGLSAGSIYLCGSDEQKQRWLPAMARMEKLGSFGLTEPEVGSGAAGGLVTTCRRDRDDW